MCVCQVSVLFSCFFSFLGLPTPSPKVAGGRRFLKFQSANSRALRFQFVECETGALKHHVDSCGSFLSTHDKNVLYTVRKTDPILSQFY